MGPIFPILNIENKNTNSEVSISDKKLNYVDTRYLYVGLNISEPGQTTFDVGGDV